MPYRWSGTECGKDQLWLLTKGLYFLFLRYVMHWNNHLCLWGQSIYYVMISTWGSRSSSWALMIEVFCSVLQLTMSRSEQHLSTFPLTSNVTNTQMCGLFPSPLPSGFCVVVCLHYRWKQHSLQSGRAGTEVSLVPRELILQIWTGPWKMRSLAQASITLLQCLLVPEGQSCCLQSVLVFQETFLFWCAGARPLSALKVAASAFHWRN